MTATVGRPDMAALPEESGQARLRRVARQQEFVISRRQALEAGLTSNMVDRRISADGPWQWLLPGVYLMRTGTPTADQRDMAALLYAGLPSAITADAALRRYGLGVREREPAAVDVLVPAGRRPRSVAFVSIHRTTRLPEATYATGSILFVEPPRAVADAARMMTSLTDVRAVVARAVQRRRCTVTQLGEELAAGPARGSAFIRQALAEVVLGIRSSAEGDLRALLIRARLPMPMFNASLYRGDVLIAMPDAWWPDAGLAVEVDSREWHLSPADWERTMRRHARMTAYGIVVLHFSPRQIRSEPVTVVATIRAALSSVRTKPTGIRALPAL